MNDPVKIDLRNVADQQKAVDALEAMIQSDGWKLYSVWLEGQRQRNQAAMCEADITSDRLHKLSGQTHLLNVTLDWPKLTIRALRQTIEAKAKKGK